MKSTLNKHREIVKSALNKHQKIDSEISLECYWWQASSLIPSPFLCLRQLELHSGDRTTQLAERDHVACRCGNNTPGSFVRLQHSGQRIKHQGLRSLQRGAAHHAIGMYVPLKCLCSLQKKETSDLIMFWLPKGSSQKTNHPSQGNSPSLI